MPALIRVYTARDPAEAHLILAHLQAHGIDGCVQGESLATALGEVPLGCATAPIVCVEEADVEQARRLVLTRPTAIAPTHCPNCNYNLTGLPEPRCPECGQPFPRPTPLAAAPWTCPRCNEILAGQFTACWKCGHERTGAE